jgi:hypothetical protein
MPDAFAKLIPCGLALKAPAGNADLLRHGTVSASGEDVVAYLPLRDVRCDLTHRAGELATWCKRGKAGGTDISPPP